jgi:hypothetical protein
METLTNAGDLDGTMINSCAFPADKSHCAYMHPFLTILGMLFCWIATRADELPVIKDSEAVQYVGKNVEVRGFVASVTISPLGTIFINFGRDYPNQTFAGFIAAGSKMENDERIAGLPGKIIGITGTIELFEGKPEIKVMSTDQITRLGSGSETRKQPGCIDYQGGCKRNASIGSETT